MTSPASRSPRREHSHHGDPRAGRLATSWRALLLFAVLCSFLPLDPNGTLASPVWAQSPAAYLLELPWRFYLLLKAGILWAPLGLLAGIAGLRGRGRYIAPMAGILGLGLIALPLQPQPRFLDVLEILAMLPGLAAGYWLGIRTRLTGMAEPSPKTETAETARATSVSGTSESTAPEAAPTHRRHHRSGGRLKPKSERPNIALRAGGVALLGIALAALIDFPRWQFAIGAGLLIYLVVLWFRPQAWLIVVPAAIPLFDLAPWTGRFFFDEFDLLMLVTSGMLMLRARIPPAAPPPPLARPLTLLFLASCLVSGIIGLLPLAPLDANALAGYWSSYNSPRLAKGVFWAGMIYLWISHSRIDRHALARLLAYGMSLGLLGVGLIGAWEHSLFVGFQSRLETYRIASIFSSMHTGGGHIEAYLVVALPFLWQNTTKLRHLAITGPLTVLTAYVMLYTVARGGVLALGIAILILLLASGRLAVRSGGRRFLAPVGMLLGIGLLVSAGIGGGYFQQRFAESGQDWQTRVTHWARTLDMMDDTPQAQLFGMGLGSFPRVYLERGPADTQPASFGFASQGDNTYFRLGAGATVYYAQRVPFTAGRNYRLELDARAASVSRLNTPVCEKQLLNSRQCAWMDFALPGDGQWHRYSRDFSSAEVGARDWLHRPPVELFLYNPDKGTVAEVDNVRLIDPEGRDLLCNGDFSRGGDCWFFKTHSHLPWHIKNVWVHVLFEQGWFGLLAFTGLTLLALTRLARAGWRGHRLAWTWLAALAGLLSVGMFDSLLDAPRLSMLLVALLLLGSGWNWGDTRRASSHSGRGRSVN